MTTLRDSIPPVPAGKIRIANCGTYPSELDADYTVHAEAIGAIHGYPTVTLRHITRGYVIAGSCMRWDEARWSVTWWTDGCRYGQRFLETSESEARAYFAKLTDYEAVSKRRQQDAYLEDTVYRPAREKAAQERAERETQDKARKAAKKSASRLAKKLRVSYELR